MMRPLAAASAAQALLLLVSLLARCSGVVITSVQPNRGSLAGGTRLHIQVLASCHVPLKVEGSGGEQWA